MNRKSQQGKEDTKKNGLEILVMKNTEIENFKGAHRCNE